VTVFPEEKFPGQTFHEAVHFAPFARQSLADVNLYLGFANIIAGKFKKLEYRTLPILYSACCRRSPSHHNRPTALVSN